MMADTLDMDRIARELGAERRGKVASGGGFFGALQLAAEVSVRFRVPEGGGRPTDPTWTEQRLVRLSPKTLEQLDKLAEHAHASPMQVAALLLERAVRTAANREQSNSSIEHK
jgi:hypothetical protein